MSGSGNENLNDLNNQLSDLSSPAPGTSLPSAPRPAPTVTYAKASTPNPSGLGSMMGAAMGALVGSLVWMGVGYVTGMEIGWIAILVGALAGWGATLLGGTKSPSVGGIAAVAGLAGILLGSYGNYWLIINTESGKQQVFKEMDKALQKELPNWSQLSTEEKQRVMNSVWETKVKPNLTYAKAMTESPKELLFLALFGGLGLYYGYRVGSGKGSQT